MFGQIKLIGDVHIGKKFESGVPLHRRGERESEQYVTLCSKLMDPGSGVVAVIQVGDIFDKFIVAPEHVLGVADAYWVAAERNPTVRYFIMRGNHDASRDIDKKSSFDLLKALLGETNVEVVDTVSTYQFDAMNLALIPWHPFKSSHELASTLTGKYDFVVGHWDVESYGGDDFNVIPYEALKGKTSHIITGHDHTAREFDKNGFHVTVTGSMLPYSHGEDPAGEKYVTLNLDELSELDPSTLKNKCVRILLKPDEELPEIDCLQLTSKPISENSEEVDMEISLDDGFDFHKEFLTTFQEHGVSEELTKECWDAFVSRG